MIIRSVNLETVCGITSRLPQTNRPEFAFAGKSNVGKSTLINGLTRRKSYARTSANPGKTQTINFYNVNDQFYLVDLPGYGYATAGVEARKQWGEMIERYLKSSASLRAVFLLIDIRHEPTEDDVLMYDWILQGGFTPIIIATKADKLKRSQIAGQLRMIRESLEERSQIRVSGTEDMKLIAWGGMGKGEERIGREDIYGVIEENL